MFTKRGFLAATVAASALFTAHFASAQDTTQIGFFGPLTGPSAQLGQSLRNGALVALDEINAAGGVLGHQIEMIEYDDRSSPEQAVRSATKLVQVDNVAFIVGSLHSGNILASGPVIEEAQVPLIGAGTSPTWLESGYTYLFRALGNSSLSIKELAKYAKAQELNEIVVFHTNDEYGNAGAKAFSMTAEEYGLSLVGDESFTRGDRDFTGQIASIVKASPDAVLIWAIGDDLGPVTKQLRQLGYFGPILGAEGYTTPEAIEIAGSTANGVILASQYLLPDSPEEASNDAIKSFLEDYVALIGRMPDSDNSYRGYDAVKLFAEAAEAAGTFDGATLRDAINNIEGYEGLAGTFNFVGGQGEGIDAVRLFAIEDGNFSEVQ